MDRSLNRAHRCRHIRLRTSTFERRFELRDPSGELLRVEEHARLHRAVFLSPLRGPCGWRVSAGQAQSASCTLPRKWPAAQDIAPRNLSWVQPPLVPGLTSSRFQDPSFYVASASIVPRAQRCPCATRVLRREPSLREHRSWVHVRPKCAVATHSAQRMSSKSAELSVRRQPATIDGLLPSGPPSPALKARLAVVGWPAAAIIASHRRMQKAHLEDGAVGGR
jgi:hypothetical protein